MNRVIKHIIFTLVITINLGNSTNAQELTIFPGSFGGDDFYEDDHRISKDEFLSKINALPEPSQSWQKYKNNNGIALISSLGFVGGFVWWASKDDGENKVAPAAVTLGTLLFSTIFNVRARKNKRDAILSYNKNVGLGNRVSPSSSGLGIVLNF